MKTEPFILDLPHELAPEEIIVRNADLVRTLDEIAAVESEMKLATAGFKMKIKEKQAEVIRLRDVLRSGKEDRPFECFERMNIAERTIETCRSDTGKVVLTPRPMTPDEHQLHMDVIINRMQEQAKQRKEEDDAKLDAATAVEAAANSGGERPHLALPSGDAIDATPAANSSAPASTKPKKKSGAQRLREKKAAAEAAAANGTKGKRPAPANTNGSRSKDAKSKHATDSDKPRPKRKKKPQPLLERHEFGAG